MVFISWKRLLWALVLLSAQVVSGFSPLSLQPALTNHGVTTNTKAPAQRLSPLFMGRAAAVRANTKAKTDGKKTKINAVFGKRIIMAVKQGGSPDPVANRMLADTIKQARSNNVPVEVSTLYSLVARAC
jgi:Transcriptional regulator